MVSRFLCFLLSFLFFSSSLAAEETDLSSQSAVSPKMEDIEEIQIDTLLPTIDQQRYNLGLVHGCINVITGSVCFQEHDLSIPGANPIPLTRSYSSGNQRWLTLRNGWNFDQLSWCLLERTGKAPWFGEFKPKSKIFYFTDGKGVIASKGHHVVEGTEEYSMYNGERSHIGWCGKKGIEGGKVHRSNFIYSVKDPSWHESKIIDICDGSGAKRRFESCHTFVYQLDDLSFANEFIVLPIECASLPNGVFVDYIPEFSKETGQLLVYDETTPGFSAIYYKTPQKDLIGSYTFSHTADCTLAQETTTGQKVHYTFSSGSQESGSYLTKVEYISPQSQTPYYTQSYDYSISNGCQFLTRKQEPLGRYLSFCYKREYAVALSAPAGVDGKEEQLYSLSYFAHTCRDNPMNNDGETQVTSASGKKTLYTHQANRITEIFESDGSCARVTCLSWNDDNHPLPGLLREKTLFDPRSKKLLKKESYTYDTVGNLTYETIQGDLCGDSFSQTDSTRYTYCDNGKAKNLVKTITNARATTTLTYLPNTDLVSSLIQKGGELQRREFFTYDDDHVLIGKIQDDGIGTKSDDLQGVTYRKITRIQAINKPPYGLPEVIVELYWNSETAEEEPVQRTRFAYDDDGNLKRKSVDLYQNGWVFYREWCWSYDLAGRCVREVLPEQVVKTFSYDALGNKLSETCGTRSWKAEYDKMNRKIRATYEGEGIPLLAESWSYDTMGRARSHIDIYSRKVRYSYDPFDHLIRTTFPPTPDRFGQLHTTEEKYEYDLFDHKIETLDGNGRSTKCAYTIRGDCSALVQPDGSTTTKQYSPDGLLVKEVLSDGLEIEYTYDAFGRVTRECKSKAGTILQTRSYTYNSYFLLSQTENDFRKTTYRYNCRGQCIEETMGGRRTTFSYDFLGRKTAICRWVSDSRFIQENREYDTLDRLVHQYQTDEQNNRTHEEFFAYNPHGELVTHTRIVDGEASITQYAYDGLGNRIATIDPYGEETHIVYHWNSSPQTTTLLPDGTQVIEIRDGRDWLWKRKTIDVFGKTVQSTEWRRDRNGNCVQEIFQVYADEAPSYTLVNQFSYDSCNRLILQKEAAGTPEEKITKYAYDSLGRTIRIDKPDGTSLYFSYDALGNLLEKWDSENTMGYRYTYDSFDRPIQVENTKTGASTFRTYDLQDNVIEERLETGQQIQRVFDPLNRVCQFLLPDKGQVCSIYTGPFLTSVERFSPLGALMYEQKYIYDTQGKVLEEIHPMQAGVTKHTYDTGGRFIKQEHFWQTFEALQYDTRSNLLALSTSDFVGKTQTLFSYDSLEQLLAEEGENTHTYAYDSLLNRVAKNHLPYQHNALNQLLSQGEKRYRYDANGNVVAITSPTQEMVLSYDAFNRLVCVAQQDLRTCYSYDAFHRRLCKTCSEKTGEDWVVKEIISFLYDGDKEIGQYSEKGKTYRILGHGVSEEIGAAIAIEKDDEVLVPLHSPFGHAATLLKGETGKPLQLLRTTAFGEATLYDARGQTLSLAASKTPWLFSSKRYDPETGFSVFLRRYYDAEVGRWISPDPVGFLDGPNLYQYLKNRPLRYFDPDGQLAVAIPLIQISWEGATTASIACPPAAPYIFAAMVAATLGWGAYELFKTSERMPPPGPFPYPGDDPTVCPGEGFEWRGKGSPESGKGSWYNSTTGEKLHSDLNHQNHDPHWDYEKGKGKDKEESRLYPDGTWESK